MLALRYHTSAYNKVEGRREEKDNKPPFIQEADFTKTLRYKKAEKVD